MTTNNLSLEQAINDLSTIKRAIEVSSHKDGIPKDHSALSVGRVTHIFGAAIGGVILLYELFAEASLTQIMLFAKSDPEVGISGVSLVAMVLPVLIMCLYFIIWREAKIEGDTFQLYVNRNFRYLKNLSFVSDVVCKFLPLLVLAISGGVQWIAPLLTIYLADFLIGGKYFIFPVRSGLIAGVVCVIASISQWIMGGVSLSLPLSIFLILSLISIAFTFKPNK